MIGWNASTPKRVMALLCLGFVFLSRSPHVLATQQTEQETSWCQTAQADLSLADVFLYIKKVQNDISNRQAAIVAKHMCGGAKALAKRHGGNPEQWLPVIMGIGKQESSYYPKAKSKANARGVMQVHWPTWGTILTRLGYNQDDLYDPNVGVPAGIAILSGYLHESGGSVPNALGKYYGAFDQTYIRGVLTKALDFIRYRETIANLKGKDKLAMVLAQLN